MEIKDFLRHFVVRLTHKVQRVPEYQNHKSEHTKCIHAKQIHTSPETQLTIL